jgi:ribosomal protein L37AE/L43A
METKLSQKLAKKFICNFCNYTTFKKCDYDKHLLTRKHQFFMNGNVLETNFDKVANNKIKHDFTCCNCDKQFITRSGLWKHKKKCIFKTNETNKTNETSIIQIENKKEIIELKEDNKELKIMIKELIKENAKQQQQIGELIPKVGNNNNNTLNQKFNINVFLNEKCKDAINMTDFVKSIQVSIEQLDFTKHNGLAHGLSKTIMDNMNKLSVFERPMHCTDVKRETLYIKDENEWTKDLSKEKIKKAINKASGKNYNALQDWKNENPDFLVNDSKSEYFTKTITTIGKPTHTIDTKIIKNLCKETYIKDSTIIE